LLADFNNVQDFWRYFNNLPAIGSLRPKANFHLFKSGVQPVWEDKKNFGAFRIEIPERDERLFTELWFDTVLALVGETLDTNSEVNGAIAARRPRKNRIEIWTDKLDLETSRKIRANIEKLIITDRRKVESIDYRLFEK